VCGCVFWQGFPGLKTRQRKNRVATNSSYFYDACQRPHRCRNSIIPAPTGTPVDAIFVVRPSIFDVILARASQGQCVAATCSQRGIPLGARLVTGGGSGGDEDMLRGKAGPSVVSNRHWEETLHTFVDMSVAVFCPGSPLQGILESLEHYNFFSARPQDFGPFELIKAEPNRNPF